MLSFFKSNETKQVEELAEQIKPQIFGILDTSPEIVERGYLMTFKKVAHVLPTSAKFTILGMKAVNHVLRQSQVTKSHMRSPAWESAMKLHAESVKQDEAHKNDRMRQRDKDNADALIFVISLLEEMKLKQDPILKNYGKLINNLRSSMRRGYRGHRGVCIIHDAMLRVILWAPTWSEYMAETEAEAKRRDDEYVAMLRSKRKGLT